MPKLNWTLYNKVNLPHGLCVGEERTLGPEEVLEANRKIQEAYDALNRLKEIFKNARHRFATGSVNETRVEIENQNLLKGFGEALRFMGIENIHRHGTALVFTSPEHDNTTYTLTTEHGLKLKHNG